MVTQLEGLEGSELPYIFILGRTRLNPPSTAITCPVIQLCGFKRNNTARAISSGFPMRPNACMAFDACTYRVWNMPNSSLIPTVCHWSGIIIMLTQQQRYMHR